MSEDKIPSRNDLLNNAQLAAIIGIRSESVTRLIRKGQLPKHNVVINQRLKFWSKDFIARFIKMDVSK
ncbi:hypothetical protein [Succinimonas amylolytica]|uniref:hypothetical protein n=1 Tax=Succinimonas amylolytica TaxID=83769 RepID=UPI0023A8A1A0